MQIRFAAAKRAVLGRPLATRALRRELLPKRLALPVFSADPLSSVAYATQEMMLVLAIAGASAFTLVQPLSAAVALLLVVVVASYRQTVRAYPSGGGAYVVAKDNFGQNAGLVAAAALLIDYVLTVAVSTAAGVAAVVSAFPGLHPHRTWLALAMVALVTLANLRGIRETGLMFAAPTYLFVGSIFALIGVGLVRCAVGGCPQAPSAGTALEPAGALTVLLLLRAFTSGAVALTGIEAISGGVSAFRYPQARNAATTLAVTGALAVAMFLGVGFLATATGVVPTEGAQRTVVAEVALAVFGDGPAFLLVQFLTAAILFLAANTAYADFPRLASVLAGDRFLPRQLVSRGDRLVFSNGILLLAAASAGLLIVFDADVTGLIQLYIIGVFTSFTLSQAGMVRHHVAGREPGWRRSATLNAVGAASTGIVLVVATVAKFTGGAWMVLVAIPLLVLWMRRVHAHYGWVRSQLRRDIAVVEPVGSHRVVMLFDKVDEPVARALSYARSIGSASVEAIATPLPGSETERRWEELAPDVPLTVLPHDRQAPDLVREEVRRRASAHPDAITNAVVCETMSRTWLDVASRHRLAVRIKSELQTEPGVVLTDFPSPEGGPGPYTIEDPQEHHVVVLVSGIHRASLRALAYARTIHSTSLRALNVNVDPLATRRMLDAWEDWGVDVPLELVDSPFRELGRAVRSYVREFAPDGRSVIVTCVLPHFVLPRWYQAPLHNQSALRIRSLLLFERGVVTTSVPTFVADDDGGQDPSLADSRERA